MSTNVSVYDMNAIVDFDVRSEIYDETYLQMLRDLKEGISGKIDTSIRLVVTKDKVDFVITKLQELRDGGYITEVNKQQLVNGLEVFKKKRNSLSLM